MIMIGNIWIILLTENISMSQVIMYWEVYVVLFYQMMLLGVLIGKYEVSIIRNIIIISIHPTTISTNTSLNDNFVKLFEIFSIIICLYGIFHTVIWYEKITQCVLYYVIIRHYYEHTITKFIFKKS